MRLCKVSLAVLIALNGGALALPGASPVIGQAVGAGPMSLDQREVSGNANLVSGSEVRTSTAMARLLLSNGARVTLGPQTRVRVFAGRLDLESGAGLIAAGDLEVRTGGLMVRPEGRARLQIQQTGGTVELAALDGTAIVRDASGMTLARVLPGRALRLGPGTPGVSTFTGVVRREDGAYRLKDEITSLDVELGGGQLDGLTGRRVSVTGAATAAGDSQRIEVARVHHPDSTASSQPPPAPGGQSVSSGTRIGIISALGGVAAALAAYGFHDGGEAPISR